MLKAKVSRRDRTDKESALQSVVKEETTRLNALIPKSLHHKLKILIGCFKSYDNFQPAKRKLKLKNILWDRISKIC